ncbi:kinase-like domain-containing protein [Apodospora peruviana]|uniref:Kinase-like domain-containing protein n=1 Tax=Apodospora peruviana TaxID=516989 RepID=A0AAE0LZW2_9PEZI|nr:kinase-like domain-containing protein [Apodospora peruviana]
MAFAGSARLAEKIQRELNHTDYACSSLEPLSGGNSNFMFKGNLIEELEDGAMAIAVKHGEDYIASSPGEILQTTRCRAEMHCLDTLSMLAPTYSQCTVRTPKLYYSNEKSNTMVLEYLPASVDLKTYVLKHLSATANGNASGNENANGSVHVNGYKHANGDEAASGDTKKSLCVGLGTSIGAWLDSFHRWAKLPEQSSLQKTAKANKDMQSMKYRDYYARLVATIDDYPSILEEARETFESVKVMAADELKDTDSLQVIHGDLWTGNAILPDAALKGGELVFIIDWEFCQLGSRPMDLGQMVAELFQLHLYKDIEGAKWLIEGLVKGYGYVDDAFAFRTAIHIGAHLISFGSRMKSWGTEEQIQQSVAQGKEIIMHAWHEDRGWFEAGDLACLFAGR